VASTAAEETGRVESDEVERESSRDLNSFVMKRNDMGQSDIYRFKNIRSGFKPELLLIVLKSGPKRF
jgi:hypothetical protein